MEKDELGNAIYRDAFRCCVQESANFTMERYNRYKRNGFRTWEELLSYLKSTDNTLYCTYDSFECIRYDRDKGKVVYSYKINDIAHDRVYWHTTAEYTDKEFLATRNKEDLNSPDGVNRNELGYIEEFVKIG